MVKRPAQPALQTHRRRCSIAVRQLFTCCVRRSSACAVVDAGFVAVGVAQLDSQAGRGMSTATKNPGSPNIARTACPVPQLEVHMGSEPYRPVMDVLLILTPRVMEMAKFHEQI